jgi:beta-phosphoglucomutase-like phosphatase (HAD superfamily)
MAIRGVIFDMDGTITAPHFDFVRIKEEAGIGDVDMLDYLRSATGPEYDRIYKLLMRFEEGGVAAAKLNRGARTLLNFLARRKIPTALAGNSSCTSPSRSRAKTARTNPRPNRSGGLRRHGGSGGTSC